LANTFAFHSKASAPARWRRQSLLEMPMMEKAEFYRCMFRFIWWIVGVPWGNRSL